MTDDGLQVVQQSRIKIYTEIEPPRRQDRQGRGRERGPCERTARSLGLSSANSWRLGGSISAIRSGHHPAIHHEPPLFRASRGTWGNSLATRSGGFSPVT